MKRLNKFVSRCILASVAVLLSVLLTSAARAQTTAFTYEGRFTDSTVQQPTTGTYNMRFALFGSPSGTDQIGTASTNSSVQVVNTIFTVTLSFTAVNAFDGAARYLEISVFNPSMNDYVKLDPRQQIMSSPYAIRTISAHPPTVYQIFASAASRTRIWQTELTAAKLPEPSATRP